MNKNILFILIITNTLQLECPDLPIIESPINILHQYIEFLFKTLDPSNNKKSSRLLNFKKELGKEYFVFEIKNHDNGKKSFIGIISKFDQKFKNYEIIKFLQTNKLYEIQFIFRDKNLSEYDGIYCPKQKQIFFGYYIKKNYINKIAEKFMPEVKLKKIKMINQKKNGIINFIRNKHHTNRFEKEKNKSNINKMKNIYKLMNQKEKKYKINYNNNLFKRKKKKFKKKKKKIKIKKKKKKIKKN